MNLESRQEVQLDACQLIMKRSHFLVTHTFLTISHAFPHFPPYLVVEGSGDDTWCVKHVQLPSQANPLEQAGDTRLGC